MKTLNQYFCTATVALLGLTTLSLAQAPAGGRGPRTPEERVKQMKETLGISDEQGAKIKAIMEKSQASTQEKMQALRADTALSQEDRRTKMAEIMKPTNDEIMAVLTPEQQTKYKEEMAKRRGGRGGAGRGAAAAGGAAATEKK
jgi:periplasmic protein CpxP/Spy